MADGEAQIEFFGDPIRPWAWITSRWVDDVARQRDLRVDRRSIALRIVNEHRHDDGDFAGHAEGHLLGPKLRRVAAAIRDEPGGRACMGELDTRLGTDIHVEDRRAELVGQLDRGLGPHLAEVGIDRAAAAAADGPSWDAVLRRDTDEALSRTGRDVGTPIITFRHDGHAPSFFAPVLNPVPAPTRRSWWGTPSGPWPAPRGSPS